MHGFALCVCAHALLFRGGGYPNVIVVPDVAGGLTEEKVQGKAFELVFAFDEVITTGGHKESITLQQASQNTKINTLFISCGGGYAAMHLPLGGEAGIIDWRSTDHRRVKQTGTLYFIQVLQKYSRL